MQSITCRYSPASIYMLCVMNFDPKGTTSEVRVHSGGILGLDNLVLVKFGFSALSVARFFDV